MRQVDPKSLEKLIFRLAGSHKVGKALRRVEIETSSDDDVAEDGALRIILRVEDLEKSDITDLAKLVGAIEDSLSEKDDRFPSVRFAEAA